jgi:hypothetical protein
MRAMVLDECHGNVMPEERAEVLGEAAEVLAVSRTLGDVREETGIPEERAELPPGVRTRVTSDRHDVRWTAEDIETPLNRVPWETSFVFPAREPLFRDGPDHGAIAYRGSRRVSVIGVDAKDGHARNVFRSVPQPVVSGKHLSSSRLPRYNSATIARRWTHLLESNTIWVGAWKSMILTAYA